MTTHTWIYTCGHEETQPCDPDCRHGPEPARSIMRCGDCIWR